MQRKESSRDATCSRGVGVHRGERDRHAFRSEPTLLGLALLAGCWAPDPSSGPAPAASRAVARPRQTSSATAVLRSATPVASERTRVLPGTPAPRYAWFEPSSGKPLAHDGTLASRFEAPPGYERVPLAPGSFGEWLRFLPMAPRNTKVLRFDGTTVREGDDEYVAGVIAIDIGTVDLQQSPDVAIRLHAEWLWSRNQRAAINYPGGARLNMPLSRWEQGQRLISEGPNPFWAVRAKPAPADYAEFRRYLDAVFAWANSVSLSRRVVRVEPAPLVPGDFFLHTKPPGQAAIVLDVAEKPSGERVALLGQALNPTESVHVLRPGRATAWFSLRQGHSLVTARSADFTWDELRRMKSTTGGKALEKPD